VKLKEALEKKTSSIKDSYEFDYLECMEYIDLLQSIIFKQDEALSRVHKIDKNWASVGASNGTYKIIEQTQSEILKMLQPESEG
jgi:hypothetical protein